FINNKFTCTCIITIIGFILSRFGFSNIVEIFYPIKGAVGFVFLVACIVFLIRDNKKSKKIDYEKDSNIIENNQNKQ
ncbi:MAG: hypothetical protein KBT30_01310, partial [Clostridiales bacterium]|nr:hypothetical protein [Candidatus Apopatousia equi]